MKGCLRGRLPRPQSIRRANYRPPQYYQFPEPASQPMAPLKGNRPLVAISWLVIVGLTSLIFGMTTYTQIFMVDQPQESREISKAELMPLSLQGKMLLGTKIIFGDAALNAGGGQGQNPMEPQVNALNTGSPEARYCAAILANEFVSAEAGLEIMDSVEDLILKLDYEATDQQVRIRNIVESLLQRYELGEFDSHKLPEDDREFLKEELGWIGQLALAPADSPHTSERNQVESEARTSTVILWVFVGLLALALLGGIASAFAFFVLTVSGTVEPSMRTPSSRGRIYAETFALWFVFFWTAQIGLSMLVGTVPFRSQRIYWYSVCLFCFTNRPRLARHSGNHLQRGSRRYRLEVPQSDCGGVSCGLCLCCCTTVFAWRRHCRRYPDVVCGSFTTAGGNE